MSCGVREKQMWDDNFAQASESIWVHFESLLAIFCSNNKVSNYTKQCVCSLVHGILQKNSRDCASAKPQYGWKAGSTRERMMMRRKKKAIVKVENETGLWIISERSTKIAFRSCMQTINTHSHMAQLHHCTMPHNLWLQFRITFT